MLWKSMLGDRANREVGVRSVLRSSKSCIPFILLIAFSTNIRTFATRDVFAMSSFVIWTGPFINGGMARAHCLYARCSAILKQRPTITHHQARVLWQNHCSQWYKYRMFSYPIARRPVTCGSVRSYTSNIFKSAMVFVLTLADCSWTFENNGNVGWNVGPFSIASQFYWTSPSMIFVHWTGWSNDPTVHWAQCLVKFWIECWIVWPALNSKLDGVSM